MDGAAPAPGVLAAFLVAAASLGGCTVVPVADPLRPPVPLPEELAHRFPAEEPGWVVFQEPEAARGARRVDGRMELGGRELAFTIFLPGNGLETAPHGGDEARPRPFLLVLPILAGGRALLRRICLDLAGRGFAAGFVERRGSLFRRGETPRELEETLRETVADNRAFLSVAASLGEVDGDRMGLVGISLGGIVGGILVAVDPRIRAASLCMAGGDLPGLVMDTAEGRVARWARARRREVGLPARKVEAELRQVLHSDPALLGAHVDPRRVLLYTPTLDRVVPPRNADLLWEAMGRPRRLLVPLGHYSTALVYDRLMREIEDFSRQRLAPSPEGAAHARAALP